MNVQKEGLAIELANVKKTFFTAGNSYEVLHDINLKINHGEFVSITGQSGSGKSTLLYLMGSIDHPTEGSIRINDKEIVSLTDKEKSILRRRTISIIYQFYNLIPEFTIEQNVLLPVLLDNKKTKDYTEKTLALLNRVGLSAKRKSFPMELSGGQQQRVAVARALMNNPDIILADEPTGNLDRKSGKEVMELLTSLNQKYRKTIVMVTHSDEIAKYSQRSIGLMDGRIVSDN